MRVDPVQQYNQNAVAQLCHNISYGSEPFSFIVQLWHKVSDAWTCLLGIHCTVNNKTTSMCKTVNFSRKFTLFSWNLKSYKNQIHGLQIIFNLITSHLHALQQKQECGLLPTITFWLTQACTTSKYKWAKMSILQFARTQIQD